MPEELDEYAVILDINTDDDIERQIQGLAIDVPPRAQDPATEAREQWQMHHLLRALLAVRQLSLPVRLYKREAPDFVLQIGNKRIGVEATEAINPDYVQAQVHPIAQGDDTVVDPSLYKWGTQGRPKFQIREEAGRTQLSGHPWMNDSVEREFARSIIDVVRAKHGKLYSRYMRYESDRLLIYHNQPSPIIDIDKARVYTATILADYWSRLGFDTVYVHKYYWMLCFTKKEAEIIYEFPRSDAPFGIAVGVWEQLGAAERTYLKLLEQEPDFIPRITICELDSERNDLFGFESDLQALRCEWFDHRDRDLERIGCTSLLQPPDGIRLRTASEVATCAPALDLFRGGVLEHVVRAIAEWDPEAAVTVVPTLHHTIACRGPEFAASMIGILRYLSGFDDIPHWASDSRKCSTILSATHPLA